jgi:hypothetical protein
MATLSGFQLVTGLTTPVLQCDEKYSTWSEPGWLHTCWSIMQNHKIHIECDFTAPPLLRERDQGLMQFLADAGVPAWKLRKINRVRIYLKVLTISDIATPCGTRLNRDRYDIIEPIPVEHSYYRWPLQKKPGETAWKYWRPALRLLIVSMSDTQLTVPLGEWTGEPRQRFKWFARTNRRYLVNSPADNQLLNSRIPNCARAHTHRQVRAL